MTTSDLPDFFWWKAYVYIEKSQIVRSLDQHFWVKF